VKPQVRSNKAQEYKQRLISETIRHREDEFHIEHLRFERGMFEAHYKDPLLNDGLPVTLDSVAQKAPAAARHAWDMQVQEVDDPEQEQHVQMTEQAMLSSQILLGLDEAMREQKAKLMHLFRSVNRGVAGALTPAEFLEGLQKLEILHPGDVSEKQIIDVMPGIDPDFDNKVNLPHLYAAINALKASQLPQGPEGTGKAETAKTEGPEQYGEALPLERVVVDRQARSLFNFEDSFQQFQKQQLALLVMHKERVESEVVHV